MRKINTYAKINLTLDILGKRPDGYHEVSMIMQSVGLADELCLEKQAAGRGIELVCDKPGLPVDSRNLAYRAAELVLSTYKIASGVRIGLKKRIPMAAGLAGGSADAAAVLRGLNELFSLRLTTKQLCALGEKLGSDVPFCICGGTMLAEGRGELLTRLPDMPECFVVLAKPAADVSTAWVYQNYKPEKVAVHPDTKAVIECIERGDRTGLSQLLCNVLESVTINRYEEIQKYKTIMCKCGALASLMSGSGSTVFALAATEQQARNIAAELTQKTAAQVFVTKTISRN